MIKRILMLVMFVIAVMIFTVNDVQANGDDYDWYDSGNGISIIKYLGNDKDIVIPDMIDNQPVTEIFSGAFLNKGINSVVIPETVTKIGYIAFNNNNLTEVHIPNSVTTIGQSAFSKNKLKKVTIPSGITTLASSVFAKNELTEVHIPSNIKTIEVFAFEENKISKVTFDEGVEKIASAAFSDNPITKMTFPASLKSLSYTALMGNHIFSLSFKGPVTIEDGALELGVGYVGALEAWYTDQAFKNKWNGKITKPMTIYAKWELTEAAKKMTLDNLSGNRVHLKKLEKGYTYTIYKDAALKQKLASYEATDVDKVLTVKGIGKEASHVYVTVTNVGFTSPAEKITYKTARTPSVAKSNVTVKYAKNKSTIQLKNLKVGTTYTIYRDVNQKVKIASFKATKTTRTITTNKLLKNVVQLYITTQQPNYRISTLAVACYPKNHVCPDEPLPSGVTIAETHKEYIKFKLNYKLTEGGTVTQVTMYKYPNRYRFGFDGVDTKNKKYYLFDRENGTYTTSGYMPVLGFGVNDLSLVKARFRGLFK